MTGAGTTSVAWTREPGFLDSPSDPTYVHAGRNVSVNDLELNNALERSRLADDNEAVESIAQNLEGALALEYDLAHPWVLTDAFVSDPTGGDPDPYEWTMGRGQMPTSRWYIGVDTFSNTVERVPKAAITTQLQLQVSLNSPVRVTQTLVYADEEKNTSMTPGTIVGGDESPYVYHGGSFSVDGTTQKKMQSGTVDITNGGSLDQGWNRKAVDAVAGDADYSMNATKIATEETSDNVTLAYGNSNAPVTSSGIDGVSGDLTLARGDGDEIALALQGVRPNTYGWDNIPPSGDERVQEGIEFYIDRVTASADVSMADPFA
ncbi:phage tail tube protein [Natronorubrum halophilum]|uniref:phage tail tube protein n=1 Tax=Natronorubrum halophilum TaxID=1702106 RepID=UPI0010C1ED28|nr:phage tail tube protein [Natronorubrum halophilum]